MASPIYVRPLSIRDMSQCITVEQAAFPPAEAATPEKIEYRLTVCPELCYGLFIRGEPGSTLQLPSTIPFESSASGAEKETLLAHTISTRATGKCVKDEDMSFPSDWKSNSEPNDKVGHQPNGKTIALHSLAVSPTVQRSGLGKALMNVYIDQFKKNGGVERISILTYDRLLPYYQKLGFTHYGKSASEYAGVAWHDLAYEF